MPIALFPLPIAHCLLPIASSPLPIAHSQLFTLAWRPMLDPLPVGDTWPLLLIPLSLGISIAYKAVRVGSIGSYPKAVLVMTTQIVLAMIAMGIVANLFVRFVLPVVIPVSP